MKIENVGQLKYLLKDLNDDLPVGIYHKNWWYPKFETKSVEIEIIKQDEEPIGLATEIDYRHDY